MALTGHGYEIFADTSTQCAECANTLTADTGGNRRYDSTFVAAYDNISGSLDLVTPVMLMRHIDCSIIKYAKKLHNHALLGNDNLESAYKRKIYLLSTIRCIFLSTTVAATSRYGGIRILI